MSNALSFLNEHGTTLLAFFYGVCLLLMLRSHSKAFAGERNSVSGFAKRLRKRLKLPNDNGVSVDDMDNQELMTLVSQRLRSAIKETDRVSRRVNKTIKSIEPDVTPDN